MPTTYKESTNGLKVSPRFFEVFSNIKFCINEIESKLNDAARLDTEVIKYKGKKKEGIAREGAHKRRWEAEELYGQLLSWVSRMDPTIVHQDPRCIKCDGPLPGECFCEFENYDDE